MTVDLLFDDGVVHLVVEPPDDLIDSEFDLWSIGVSAGINRYLAVTQKDHNYKKAPIKHKHSFKFIEPSELNDILWFACIKCDSLGQINRVVFTKELLDGGS